MIVPPTTRTLAALMAFAAERRLALLARSRGKIADARWHAARCRGWLALVYRLQSGHR